MCNNLDSLGHNIYKRKKVLHVSQSMSMHNLQNESRDMLHTQDIAEPDNGSADLLDMPIFEH